MTEVVFELDPDQPTTCPVCGARTEFEQANPKQQLHSCDNCDFTFIGEFPEEEELTEGIANGSHGSICFNIKTGEVLWADAGNYDDIINMNVGEFVKHYGSPPSEVDILDIGFWSIDADNGELEYLAPEEDWRKRHS